MRTIRIVLLLALCTLFQFGFSLGNGAIRGKILGPDNLPVIGANVFTYVGSSLVGSSTDFNGVFNIKPLPAGVYDITVTFIGFDTLKIEGIKVKGDGLVFLKDHVMGFKTFKGVDIVEYREPLINKVEPMTIDVLPETFQRSPNRSSLSNMIASQSSEVFQEAPGEPLYFRGARAGSVIYMVDGMKSFSASESLPSAAIGSMRIYTGGIPAQYGDLLGGIVVIETKSYLDMYKR